MVDLATSTDNYQKVFQSVQQFPDQIEQMWSELKNISFPEQYHDIRNVVICGMGGSALGGRVIRALMQSQVNIPIEVCTEFVTPSYVSSNTLVITSSYSGNTEETLSAFHDAVSKKAKIIGIAAGGKLLNLCNEAKYPCVVINPLHNAAGQPRLATGYSITAILGILSKLEVIHVSDSDVSEAITHTKDCINGFGVKSSGINSAYSLAQSLKDSIPVLIASEHLMGAVHVVKNQLNETAKNFSVSFDIPELNHHLMEGLGHPLQNKQLLKFLFFNSKHYSEQVKKRYPLTIEVVEKNNISHLSYNLTAQTKLAECFEIIALGGFIQLYLAQMYGVDPTSIPWVDYFKSKLA